MAKKIAFTLAETLIVMGIIGVVAALTIPNLNSSTADKEKVAKVKKIYQNLDDALGRAQAVYGPYDEWTLNITNTTSINQRIGERITEFMKVSKIAVQATRTIVSKMQIFTGQMEHQQVKNFQQDTDLLLRTGHQLQSIHQDLYMLI